MTDKRRPPDSLEQLAEDHRALEMRLAELDRHLTLTSEEQLERARLKKLKLAMKDRLAKH
jgi:uncharacterized protein YdcH (DUF465 family)